MMSPWLLQRLGAAITGLILLSGCSSDGLAPPQPIGRVDGKHVHIRSARADRQLVGRVDNRSVAYAAPSSAEQTESMDFLNTPNLAGYDTRRQQRLPKIDEEPATEADSVALNSLAAEDDRTGGEPRLTIPAGGVNIDGGLGIGQAADGQDGNGRRLAAAPSPMAIPEGNSSQPVVGGIGTDNPSQLRPAAGFDMPDPLVTGTSRAKGRKR